MRALPRSIPSRDVTLLQREQMMQASPSHKGRDTSIIQQWRMKGEKNITRPKGDTNTQNRFCRIGSMLSQLFRLNQTGLILLAFQSLVRRKWKLTA